MNELKNYKKKQQNLDVCLMIKIETREVPI